MLTSGESGCVIKLLIVQKTLTKGHSACSSTVLLHELAGCSHLIVLLNNEALVFT
jgi:hypothetical protein